MLHLAAAAALVITPPDASPAQASTQQDVPPPADPQRASGNSPSEATATVSPITAAAAVEPADAAGEVEVSLGTSVAVGDFGSSSDTSIWSTALGVRATLADVRLSASVPFMRVRSNATIFTGIDSTPVVIAPGVGPKRTGSGFGDVTLGASYTLPHRPGDLEIELAGRVKLPTATDGSRLSSGKTDYSLGLQATKPVGRVAPFVSATYRFLGDPAAFDLRDGIAASAGASFAVDGRTVLLGSYHYARAATRFIRDGHELFLGGSREMPGGRLRLTAFGTAGLSSGAAAVSGGVALSFAL